MDLTVRRITAGEVTEFRSNLRRGFGGDIRSDDADEATRRFRALVDLDRTYAAFDGATMVGTAAAFGFGVTTPGGSVPIGGLTMVTVRPTHTRRGVMSAMMAAHFDDALDRDEAVSGLWASESPIYGRFGYGAATERVRVRFDARLVGFPGGDRAGEISLIDAGEHVDVLTGIYERALGQRPGMLTRSAEWWEHDRLHDPPEWRDGASARRAAVLFRDGDAVGYALYRQKENWDGDLPAGAVDVSELISVDAPARLELWRFLASIDLFPHVTYWNEPTDLELPWQASDRRRISRNVFDALYLRVLDVPGALEARRYGEAGSLVLGVGDVDGEMASYRLETSPEGADCTPTTTDPDVAMDVRALGAIYLGAAHTHGLALAGEIAGHDDAIVTLDRLFRSPLAPWCPEVF